MDSERDWAGEELDGVLDELGESDADDLDGFSIKDSDDEDDDDDEEEEEGDDKPLEDGLDDEEEGII
jgi:hypothetical protein